MGASGAYQPPQSVRVFVSHVREDNERLKPLLTALDAWGVDYWFDEESLLPGDAITPEIHTAIETRDYFIRVVSFAMQGRPGWVDIETNIFLGLRAQDISAGAGNKRRLINVILDPGCPVGNAAREFSPILAFDRPPRLWLQELRNGLHLLVSALDTTSTKVGGLSPDLSAQLLAQIEPSLRQQVLYKAPQTTRQLSASPHRNASLLVVRTPEEHKYVLSAPTTAIQRVDHDAIGLRDDAVSRVQATITQTSGGEYFICDGDGTSESTNGTWVEGKRISSERVSLKDGDLITMGETILKFER